MNFFWETMELFEERARIPLRMTYRAVGTTTGQLEFLGTANGGEPFNHFGAGDSPMSASDYQTLVNQGGNMVHIPFVLQAVAVYHRVPGVTAAAPIGLDACTLAKVFSLQITAWDDAAILALNPNLRVAGNAAIRVTTSLIKG